MVQIIVQSVRRLALKIASYGAMHLVVAILVAFAITRDWRLALAVGMVEPIFQTVAYTVHDRVWHRIDRKARMSDLEEAAEAVYARIDVMDDREQDRVQERQRGHAGHSHALPRSAEPGALKKVALKTVTYGLMHFTVAVGVALALTQNWRLALAIGVVEPLVQTVFFAAHDRIWSRIEARKAADRASRTSPLAV